MGGGGFPDDGRKTELRDAVRRGAKAAFDAFERDQALKAVSEGRVSGRAYAEERKVLRVMRAYSWLAFVLMFGSVGLALWLFWSGEVGGGFGAAFVGLFFSFVHGLGAAAAKAIDEKHYWAAAYDWAERKTGSRRRAGGEG